MASNTLAKFRGLARDGLAHMSPGDRHAYGEAVERAILAMQRSELQRSIGPIKPRVRCASGTGHNDGTAIHEAIRAQQLNALLAWPGKVRRNRADVEWQNLYDAAMNAKAAAIAERVLAGGRIAA